MESVNPGGRVPDDEKQGKPDSIQLELPQMIEQKDRNRKEHAAVLAELTTVRQNLEKNLMVMAATEEEIFQLQLQLTIHETANTSLRESHLRVGGTLLDHMAKATKTLVIQKNEKQHLLHLIDTLVAKDERLREQREDVDRAVLHPKKKNEQLAEAKAAKYIAKQTNSPPAQATDIGPVAVVAFFSVLLVACLVVGKPKR